MPRTRGWRSSSAQSSDPLPPPTSTMTSSPRQSTLSRLGRARFLLAETERVLAGVVSGGGRAGVPMRGADHRERDADAVGGGGESPVDEVEVEGEQVPDRHRRRRPVAVEELVQPQAAVAVRTGGEPEAAVAERDLVEGDPEPPVVADPVERTAVLVRRRGARGVAREREVEPRPRPELHRAAEGPRRDGGDRVGPRGDLIGEREERRQPLELAGVDGREGRAG